MTRQISLYSFSNRDRSGKVRWTACELGYSVDEHRLELGEQVQEAYAALNPYRQVPVAQIEGEVMIESTAVCINLAEKHPEHGLIPPPGHPSRPIFWQHMGITTQTLELPVVNYFLGKAGIVAAAWVPLLEESLRAKLATFAADVPVDGWWLGNQFTLADIFAAYVLRIGVSGGLLGYSGAVKDWLERLMRRPAANEAGFFDGFVGA